MRLKGLADDEFLVLRLESSLMRTCIFTVPNLMKTRPKAEDRRRPCISRKSSEVECAHARQIPCIFRCYRESIVEPGSLSTEATASKSEPFLVKGFVFGKAHSYGALRR